MPWTAKPSIGSPRAHAAAVAQGNKIFVMGGVGKDGTPMSSVEIYDPKTEQWTEGPPLPTPRSHLGAVMLQERIFALGGKGSRSDGSTEPLKTVEIFNPAVQKWEKGPDLLSFHSAGGVAVWRGIIYVVGGEHPEGTGENNPGIGSAEKWDPLRKKWLEIPPMPTPRFDFATIGFNNRLIVMGGRVREKGRDQLLERAEAYETAKGVWEEYPLTKLPVPAAGVGVCSMANLFILGGETQEGISDKVHSVDQLQRRWIEMDPLPEPRTYAMVLTNVAGMDNSIYLIGGRNAAGEAVNTVFAFKT